LHKDTIKGVNKIFVNNLLFSKIRVHRLFSGFFG